MDPVPDKTYVKKGCVQCQGEGTRGRLPVFEVLSLTDELKLFVLASFDADAFRAKWRSGGGLTLGMDALNLVAAGEVDPGELDSLTAEVLSFQNLAQNQNPRPCMKRTPYGLSEGFAD